MAFKVTNDDADRLLRELTSLTGETLAEAITISLRDRLQREQRIRAVANDGSLAGRHSVSIRRRGAQGSPLASFS